MGNTKWVAAVVIAVLIVFAVVLILPREQARNPGVPPVLEPVPEDAVPPAQKPVFAEFNLIAYNGSVSPSILTLYAGQRGEIRLNALDAGAGDGYRLVLPSFNLSVHAMPGVQGRQSFTPRYLGTFRFDIVSGGEVVDTGVITTHK